MQTLKSFLDQSLLIWKDSTAAARFGLAILLVICIGGVTGVGYWSSQPQYVTLTTELSPELSLKLIDAFESADIKYKILGSGGVVKVDNRNLSRASALAGNLGVTSNASSATYPKEELWLDPATREYKHNLFRQEQIKQAILRSNKSIATATVLLSKDEEQPFIRRTNAPTAAVSLTLKPRSKFNEGQATAIATMVAHSVTGLTVDQVSITADGRIFETDDSIGQLNKQEEYRLFRNREYAAQAESLLVPFLGFGNAKVIVSTDFTFNGGTMKTHKFDPDGKVVISEMTDLVTSTGESAGANGQAGSGLGDSNAAAGKAKIMESKTEKLENTFDHSYTTREEQTNTPILNALTVSVVVNSKAITDTSPEMISKIQEAVQNAVGFRDTKDEISVMFFDFIELPELEAPGFVVPWDQINEVIKNISLGIAAIIAFFVAAKAFKKLQPDPSVAPELADRKTQVDQLSELVQQNPEVFSKIIASWSNLDSQEDSATIPTNAKRAA